MIGGTVGVTRQWDMDWILLSDSSVPNVEVPKINFFKDDVAVASQSGVNLKAGANIGITAVNDVINNRVDYIITSLGGDIPVSSITAATATNIINNANNTQEWQWNSLTSGIGLKLSSNSTAATSNSQTLFSVNQSGANTTSAQTTYGAIFSNTKTGTASTNIAGRFVASGADNNYAISADGLMISNNNESSKNSLFLDNTSHSGVGYSTSNQQIAMRDKNAGI